MISRTYTRHKLWSKLTPKNALSAMPRVTMTAANAVSVPSCASILRNSRLAFHLVWSSMPRRWPASAVARAASASKLGLDDAAWAARDQALRARDPRTFPITSATFARIELLLRSSWPGVTRRDQAIHGPPGRAGGGEILKRITLTRISHTG